MTAFNTHDLAEKARRYRGWLRSTHGPSHTRRTAERHAAFLLPYLKPGMDLLDAGCGPGSISVGLSKLVVPGTVTGVDISVGAIEAARALARDRDPGRIRFAIGDVTALPFDDESFDAVFIHAVLQHLPNPEAAISEAYRVLRPGGVVGVADADFGGSIIWPGVRGLTASLDLVERLRAMGGGNPRVGRELGLLLADAGFHRVTGSATVAFEGTAAATARTGAFWSRYMSAHELQEYVVALAWASPEHLEEMRSAWIEWGETAGAFWARFWCEAIGWRGPVGP